MKKRLFTILMILTLCFTMAAPAMAAAPGIKEIEFDGVNTVEVDFVSEHVQYQNLKVVVTNPSGQNMSVTILKKENDEIHFKVKNLQPKTKYDFTISGIRDGSSGAFGSVSGRFSTPAFKVAINHIEYDAEDKEIEIDFSTKVTFKKNLKVTVKDAKGNTLKVKRIGRGDDELAIRVNGVVVGKKYTVTVSGVSVFGLKKYETVKKTFRAR